jgi:hypothetical protein
MSARDLVELEIRSRSRTLKVAYAPDYRNWQVSLYSPGPIGKRKRHCFVSGEQDQSIRFDEPMGEWDTPSFWVGGGSFEVSSAESKRIQQFAASIATKAAA